MEAPRPPIGLSESLFRGLREHGWILPDGSVAPDAVDVQGTSVFRSAFISALGVLALRPDDIGVAQISIEKLPRNISNPNDPTSQWEPFVQDDPQECSVAHAEVRFRKAGSASTETHRVKSVAMKMELQAKVAEAMTVVLRR